MIEERVCVLCVCHVFLPVSPHQWMKHTASSTPSYDSNIRSESLQSLEDGTISLIASQFIFLSPRAIKYQDT